MLKDSTSLHKIPYFDLGHKTLESVDKDKVEYHDVMCVCPPTTQLGNCAVDGRPEQAGYKFQFNYSIQPTMEPISYKLKGYKQNASLSYNDIGTDINNEVNDEVSQYMEFINTTYFGDLNNDIKHIVNNYSDHAWNNRRNWTLQNKIFQKMRLFEYKGEEYAPESSLKRVCMGVNIQSSTYIVTAKFTIIDWHDLND